MKRTKLQKLQAAEEASGVKWRKALRELTKAREPIKKLQQEVNRLREANAKAKLATFAYLFPKDGSAGKGAPVRANIEAPRAAKAVSHSKATWHKNPGQRTPISPYPEIQDAARNRRRDIFEMAQQSSQVATAKHFGITRARVCAICKRYASEEKVNP